MKIKIFFFFFLLKFSKNIFELNIFDNSFTYINIGTPKQKLKFYIDFQSNINLIFEKNFNSSTLNKSHIYYKHKTSQGIFSGFLSNELFEFENEKKFTLDFVLCNDSSVKNLNFDGILGFGFSDKNSELSSFSFITFLKKENIIFKEIISVNLHNKKLIIGDNVINDNFIIKNKSEINLLFSNKHYPITFSLFNGISFYDDYNNFQFNNEENYSVVFELKDYNNNYLIVSKNIFDKFKNSFQKENNINIKKKNLDNSNDNLFIISNDNNYNYGFNYNESNILLLKNPNVKELEINVNSDIDDYIFYNLISLKSEIVVFDYTKMKLLIYNCLTCGLNLNKKEEKYLNLFIFILLISTIGILIMLLIMKSMIRTKKINHPKFLKTYNLII